jgi:CTD small phosphatase-like protein 2
VQSKERIIWAQKIKGYYLSEVVKGIAGINERAFEHLTISLEILRSCMSLALPNIAPQNTVDVPIFKENVGKKTLVIDLDETLFHCSEERNNPEDIEITLSFDDTHEKGYVSIRPYAISFLKRMRKHYEIVAFTASERSYADTILN